MLATLIPMTDTSEVLSSAADLCHILLSYLRRLMQMNFSSWSGYEPLPGGDQGGVHYTLAARAAANQLFSVSVSPNGLNGSLLRCAPPAHPGGHVL